VRLADTTAWFSHERESATRESFSTAVSIGEIATCDMVKLELLYSERNGVRFDERRAQLDALPACPIGPVQWRRAIDVYRELAHQGGAHQRSVGHQDLLIAAAAESAGVELLHYDEDFERIGAVTGQPMRWLAPRGSL
jgi:predicted nucleic acid-binding protein